MAITYPWRRVGSPVLALFAVLWITVVPLELPSLPMSAWLVSLLVLLGVWIGVQSTLATTAYQAFISVVSRLLQRAVITHLRDARICHLGRRRDIPRFPRKKLRTRCVVEPRAPTHRLALR